MAARKLDLVMADDITLDLDAGLVDGLLDPKSLSVFYGDSGTGKTFVVLDLAAHIACGMKWRDLEVDQGFIVYVAAENPKSILRRIYAWRQDHKPATLPIGIVVSPVNLSPGNTGDTKTLIKLIADLERQPKMIVIDTLARAMRGDENSSEDMGKFVRACEELRDAFECHVMIIHHTGKDQSRGARGSSALRAAVDTEIEISKGRGEFEGVFQISKARDGDMEGREYGFRLEDVQLGANSRGRQVKTAVVRPHIVQKCEEKTKLGSVERIVLDVFEGLARESRGVVSVEAWKLAAFLKLTQERKAQAFDRAANGLVAKGLVIVDGDKAMTFSASMRP